MYTEKLQEDKVEKAYYFLNDRDESISYHKRTVYWRPNFKELSVSYITNDVAKYNSFKTDLKINKFKQIGTEDMDDSRAVLTFYENPEIVISIVTSVGRNKTTDKTEYTLQVVQQPLLKVMPAPR